MKLKGDPSSRPLLSLSLKDLKGATVVEGQKRIGKAGMFSQSSCN